MCSAELIPLNKFEEKSQESKIEEWLEEITLASKEIDACISRGNCFYKMLAKDEGQRLEMIKKNGEMYLEKARETSDAEDLDRITEAFGQYQAKIRDLLAAARKEIVGLSINPDAREYLFHRLEQIGQKIYNAEAQKSSSGRKA